MKHSAQKLQTAILGVVCFIASISLSAQVSSSETEHSYEYNTDVLDLGSNGIAVVSSESYATSTDPEITRFDSTAKQVWQKSYKQPYGKRRHDIYMNSADGNDIYILSFKSIEEKNGGGGEDLALTWVDAKSGESKMKEFPVKEFGHIYSMYANSKYLFVYTTFYQLDGMEIEKNPARPKLYRFEKATMEMQLLKDEMGGASTYVRVFWQVFRVENDFVEAYVIKEAAQHIVVALARFDNDGKKIKSAEVSFDLKETFARQTNGAMPLGPGIKRGVKTSSGATTYDASHNVVTDGAIMNFVYPISSCYLHYDPREKNYYAYGICGPEAQKNSLSKFSGFYIARIDADFALAGFKEYANVPLLTGDKEFYWQAQLQNRRINATSTPTDKLVICASAEQNRYYFSIDPVTLALKKSVLVKGIFSPEYVFTASLDKNLYKEEAVSAVDKMARSSYIPGPRWQYVVIVPYKKSTMYVFSSPMH